MEDLDKILENAESFMKRAEEYGVSAEKKDLYEEAWKDEWAAWKYTEGIYYELRALYEQNKAVIQLLRQRKIE